MKKLSFTDDFEAFKPIIFFRTELNFYSESDPYC